MPSRKYCPALITWIILQILLYNCAGKEASRIGILNKKGLRAGRGGAINGSRLTAHGSRLTAHGSRLTAHGSRLTAHGSRLTAHGLG
ncbi:MAG: hypothetical protein DU430_08905, partial [Candidatus Tokpelaia sp.]